MSLPNLDKIDLKNKKVILRADLNVPTKEGEILDNSRILSLLPTIDYLIQKGASIVLISHFGRPKGKVAAELSLKQILPTLEKCWKKSIFFAEDCIGPHAQQATQNLKSGEIVLLENLRFHPEEEENDLHFAQELAKLGDLYVNDGFAVSHRAHASVHAITQYLPSFPGLLMTKEINALSQALQAPQRPLAAIVAGSKVSTKLDLLKNLLSKVDILMLSGGIANTFLKARHIEIGTSLYEPSMLETTREIEKLAHEKQVEIVLPVDATGTFETDKIMTLNLSHIPQEFKILDIGPETISLFKSKLNQVRTLVWNGPLGVFEIPPFDQGTTALAQAVAELSRHQKLFSIAGGGETLAALAQAKSTHDFSYLSTAGGAFLEWLEGKDLPGIKALIESNPKAC
ncbi:MAG: phosphoglycerate kinase [Candidatus Paracaedimonas acanthamoebae]|uniref:Phosphoglycerate kinase n=1 Tax=Candidatus Paracaedimonas acanthamoebae TaxID=244581 RepID=A0A8J7Q118_9PROT|nr:phosphoglycerate kinase [Candidatus Paracaedimonas acanthamoebae]